MTESITFRRNHFASHLSPEDARELFRRSVQYIEIETFTYCNRKCWFCPNATMPERQDKAGNRYMPEALYLRILDELASVGYSPGFAGQIQFGRYNEPLADRIILARIAQARERLPKAWLYLHTNGDFLTCDYLDELRAAGLSELAVQTYLGNDKRYNEDDVLWHQHCQLHKLGLSARKTLVDVVNLRHQVESDYPGMQVTLDARNFDEMGTDRGGLVEIRQDKPRTAPCLIPFSRMYVDWDGSVVPCCNIRSDRPEHADFVVARLQDGTSIFDAFVALHGWRKSLMRFGPKSGPCATCHYEEHQIGQESQPELDRIYQIAEAVA